MPFVLIADLRVCGGSNTAMMQHQQLLRSRASGAGHGPAAARIKDDVEAIDEACLPLLVDYRPHDKHHGRDANAANASDRETADARSGQQQRRPWFGHLANVDDHPLEIHITLAVPRLSSSSSLAPSAQACAPSFVRVLDASSISSARDAGVCRRFGACMVDLEYDGALFYRGETNPQQPRASGLASDEDQVLNAHNDAPGTLVPLPHRCDASAATTLDGAHDARGPCDDDVDGDGRDVGEVTDRPCDQSVDNEREPATTTTTGSLLDSVEGSGDTDGHHRLHQRGSDGDGDDGTEMRRAHVEQRKRLMLATSASASFNLRNSHGVQASTKL